MEFKGEMHSKEYVYDFAKDGGAQGVISLSAKAGYKALPEGAMVMRVHAKVVEAVASAGAATLSWGTTSDSDGYSGTAKALAALGANEVHSGVADSGALLPSSFGASDDFVVEIGTADLTAGKLYFVVEYYLAGEKA